MNLKALCQQPATLSLLESPYSQLVQELADQIGLGSALVPFDHKQSFWKVMTRNRIEVPNELFENMEIDDSLEMWSVNPTRGIRFVLAMGQILTCTSYSLEDLATLDWTELFARPTPQAERILNAVRRALETNTTQMGVTDWHRVSETKNEDRHFFEAQVSQITPFRGPVGIGVFALVKTRLPSFQRPSAAEAVPTDPGN